MSADEQHFQVDLRGVVDLLSRHIYSGPRVYLRELLQNARDAITARAEVDGAGGRIRITPLSDRSDEFVLRDDGVGLTADEVGELLATVGRSSKRDIFDLPRHEYLGQFGIGLLSCFMVADEIVIRSRSARGGDPVEWSGRTDGTFTVSPGPADTPIGTSVHLRPRFGSEDLLRTTSVMQLAQTFAEFLGVRIDIDLPGGGESRIDRAAPFLDARSTPDAAVEYGAELLGTAPFAVVPIDAAGTGTRGLAYVLPYAPPPGSHQAARVYLNRMLLSERVDDLLPEWAFFVRAVVDSTALSPTASRESLVEDDALENTRADLGQAIRRWILDLGLSAPERLAQFVAIHEVSLKALVRHDDELARFITRWLSVETTSGRMTIGDLVTRFPSVRYAATVDEYRQVAGLESGAGPLVNGGYLYDSEIIELLPELFPAVTVERVDVLTEFERLDPPPFDDRPSAISLEDRATAALSDVDCTVIVRSLELEDVPAVYVADPAVLRRIDRGRARGATGGLWSSVLNTIDDATAGVQEDAATSARLCLNWANPVGQSLVRAEGEPFDRTVQLLYVQALLAGHRPLAPRDRALMTRALGAMIDLSARSAD